MSVDGAWNITMKTPIGEQKSTLVLTEAGGVLSGTLAQASGPATPITDGIADGGTLSWKAAITQPMPLTLEFSATVVGDTISGNAKLGMFGNAPFSGVRA
jgi:hypothetical protein